jgi:hypothetical protein
MNIQKGATIWRGNSFSVGLNFKTKFGSTLVPLDLTGSELVFRAGWEGGSFRKTTAETGFTIDNAALGQTTLELTFAETRLLPQGSVRVEVERRIGGKQTSIYRAVWPVNEWVNDD